MIKKIVIFSCILMAVIIASGVIMMRKEMPYGFELVEGNSHVWVIVTTNWITKDFRVILKHRDNKGKEYFIANAEKAVKIDGLINGESYNAVITRKDLLGRLKYKSRKFNFTHLSGTRKYIVLTGASVGRHWDLNYLSKRIKREDLYFGYRGLGDFDKTPLINQLTASPVKPDTVIIKECAAYFPRDASQSINEIKQWVVKLQKSGIKTVLATVVPVTEERNNREKPEKIMKSINEFNNAIRLYAEKEDIPVLDLQKVLSEEDRSEYLDRNLSADDGLHLNKEAYTKLDAYIADFFNRDHKL